MDMIERRAFLWVTDNPDRALDYVVTLAGKLPACEQAQSIMLRYIPDRKILNAEAFANYLNAIGQCTWDSPEDLAVTVLTDVNNEIIGRWMQVTLSTPDQQSPLTSHGVVLEDRQPGWDNPSLMGRLERI